MGLWKSSTLPQVSRPFQDDVEMGDVFSEPPGSFTPQAEYLGEPRNVERVFPASILLALSCFSFLMFFYHLGVLTDSIREAQSENSAANDTILLIIVDLLEFLINTVFPFMLAKFPAISTGKQAVVFLGLWPLCVLVLAPFSRRQESVQFVHVGSGLIASVFYFGNVFFRREPFFSYFVVFEK